LLNPLVADEFDRFVASGRRLVEESGIYA